jgi:hypothetical protein
MNSVVGQDYKGAKARVEVITIDHYCALRKASPCLMKVDAEGFDSNVIRGAKGALFSEALQAVIIESADEEVQALFGDAGFTAYSYDPFSRNLGSPREHSCNQIYIKDRNFVESRLKTAPAVTINGYLI